MTRTTHDCHRKMKKREKKHLRCNPKSTNRNKKHSKKSTKISSVKLTNDIKEQEMKLFDMKDFALNDKQRRERKEMDKRHSDAINDLMKKYEHFPLQKRLEKKRCVRGRQYRELKKMVNRHSKEMKDLYHILQNDEKMTIYEKQMIDEDNKTHIMEFMCWFLYNLKKKHPFIRKFKI